MLSIYVAVASVYALLATTLAPAIIDQGRTLMSNLPNYIDRVQGWYASALHMAGADAVAGRSVPGADDVKRSSADSYLLEPWMFLPGIVGVVLNTLLLLFLSAFFVVQAKTIWAALLRWLPEKYREPCGRHINPLAVKMGGYVRGQVLTAMVVATYFAIAFSVLGLNYALALAALSGLLNLVLTLDHSLLSPWGLL